MTSGSYLLFHRDGGLWGIDSGRVARIGPGRGGHAGPTSEADAESRGETLRVELAGGTSGALAADRVEGVVAGLAVRPLGSALRTFWPEGGIGVALHAGRPVILLDPLHLPLPLIACGEPDA